MNHRLARRPRRSRLGLTLVEMMIAAAISMVLTLAAFKFAAHQSRAMGLSGSALSIAQAGRSSMDLLVEDIHHAGAGVGYEPDGTFSGIIQGTFFAGTAQFNSSNNSLALESGTIPSDDLGIRTADGSYSTIADWSLAGTAQVCSGSGITAGELVVVRSDDALAARTVSITAHTPGAGCTNGLCLTGCDTIAWSASPAYLSEPAAVNTSYLGGELSTGFKAVVWFVEATDPSRVGIGALRRATVDATRTCTARDHQCGDLIAEGVESMQLQIWEWDPANNRWNNVTGATPTPWSRLRVDVELVFRARALDDRRHDSVELRLEAGRCIPSCTTPDYIHRTAIRASAEIKNSGRTRIR